MPGRLRVFVAILVVFGPVTLFAQDQQAAFEEFRTLHQKSVELYNQVAAGDKTRAEVQPEIDGNITKMLKLLPVFEQRIAAQIPQILASLRTLSANHPDLKGWLEKYKLDEASSDKGPALNSTEYAAYEKFREVADKAGAAYRRLQNGEVTREKIQPELNAYVKEMLGHFAKFEASVDQKTREALLHNMQIFAPGNREVEKLCEKYNVAKIPAAESNGESGAPSGAGLPPNAYQAYEQFKKLCSETEAVYHDAMDDPLNADKRKNLKEKIDRLFELFGMFKAHLKPPTEEAKAKHLAQTGARLVSTDEYYMERIFKMWPDHPGLREWREKNLRPLENPDNFIDARPSRVNQSDLAKMDRLNRAMGYPLFNGKVLWNEHPGAIALRFRLELESSAESALSYKLPVGTWTELGATGKVGEGLEKFKPFGVRAYDMRVIGAVDAGTYEINIMYSNKGDRPMQNVAFNAVLEKEAAEIAKGLSCLGRGSVRKIKSSGKNETVYTWQLERHHFVLSWQEGEFVKLKIYTKSRAEAATAGVLRKLVRLSDLKKNVVRDEAVKGDVYLKNVPMVDQGQKGYCAPATAERMFRYVGIEVDQHSIAQNAETQQGGGTYITELLKNIRQIASKTRMEYDAIKMEGAIDLKTVQKYIDRGIPLGWSMYVTEAIENRATERTKMRKGMSLEEYVAFLKNDIEKTSRVRPDKTAGHIRMIIGYNADTNEIAISDSWGEEKYIRWMAVSEADKVTQHEYFAIYPK